jgi:hypothetical protein
MEHNANIAKAARAAGTVPQRGQRPTQTALTIFLRIVHLTEGRQIAT